MKYIVAIALLIAATPAFGQHMPTAMNRATRDRSPYESTKDSPYSNRSQRKQRRDRETAKAIERDSSDSYFHFKPAKRDNDD